MPGAASRFRDLHRGAVLVLPNAWDAASAALIEAAGAPAIATTSAGVSWALGKPDGQGLDRAQLAAATTRIVQVVSVPVSADIEGGYGAAPGDVADTVRAVIAAGAVGINLEDSPGCDGRRLQSAAGQARRIAAARAAADAEGVDLFINARTDCSFSRSGSPATGSPTCGNAPRPTVRRAPTGCSCRESSISTPSACLPPGRWR